MPKIKYMDVIYNSYRMRKLCPNNNYKNKGVIPKTPNSFSHFSHYDSHQNTCLEPTTLYVECGLKYYLHIK